MFLNSIPEKAHSLRESQQMLEQIAQTRNNTHLLTVAAAMSTMITTLSQDAEKDGNVEALVNAIVNGIRLLEIHQNSLVQLLIAEEIPVYRITKLRECIENLNLVSTKQPPAADSSIKTRFDSSKKELKYDDSLPTMKKVFYQLRTEFCVIDTIRSLIETYYNKETGRKVMDYFHKERDLKFHISNDGWWDLLKKYFLFLAEKHRALTISNQGKTKNDEQLENCLAKELVSLYKLSCQTEVINAGVIMEKIERQEKEIKENKRIIKLLKEIIDLQQKTITKQDDTKSIVDTTNTKQEGQEKSSNHNAASTESIDRKRPREKTELEQEHPVNKKRKKIEEKKQSLIDPVVETSTFHISNEITLLRKILYKTKEKENINSIVARNAAIIESMNENIQRHYAIKASQDSIIMKSTNPVGNDNNSSASSSSGNSYSSEQAPFTDQSASLGFFASSGSLTPNEKEEVSFIPGYSLNS